jgi:vitamin B12 transporter
MNTFRISVISAAMIAAAPAFATDATTQDEIIVTARRSAETVDDTLASVSVITRADIERSQAPDLLELLRLQPGIDLARTGGSGQSTALFLRGSNSNHTLVLIDGVRVSPLLSGAYDYAHLPIAQIERIEIVRGPQAAYWGSEAIGGVIQIFTRQPQSWSVRAGAGTHGTSTVNASAALRGERGMIGVTVGRNETDGISAQNENGFSFDPDRDGYQNEHASLRAETDIGAQKLALTALRTDAEVEFDDGITLAEDTAIGLSLEGSINGNWSHRLALGSAADRLETAAFFAIYDSRRRTLDWQNQFALGEDAVVHAGINYAEEHGRDISMFDNSASVDERRDNRALHLGYRREWDAHEFEIAARHDDNSEFGGDQSLQAAWGWRFTDSARLLVNYGEGFRAPTLNEQFSPGFGGLFSGNPDLDPERSRSVEVALHLEIGDRQSLQVQAYSSRIRDLISFTGGNTFQAENIARADIDGVELSHRFELGAWNFVNTATVQNAENADTGNDLLRRPARKWTGIADYRFENGFSLGGEVLMASKRKDFSADLPGYGVVSLRAAFRFNPTWRIEARIDNVLDKPYELAHGYNTMDRSGVIAIVAGD